MKRQSQAGGRIQLGTAAYWAWRPWMGVPVQASIGEPRTWGGPPLEHLRRLAPWGLKHVHDLEQFTPLYRARLERIDRLELLRVMAAISHNNADRPLVLLCFEPIFKPGQWCHRRVFAEWWEEQYGDPVPELHDKEAVDG